MKRNRLINILGTILICTSFFYAGKKYNKNQFENARDRTIETYLTEKEIKSYLSKNNNLKERINFSYKLNKEKEFDQVMNIKHLKIKKEKDGKYSIEINNEKEPIELKIWKNESGKIRNFNARGYGFSELDPKYFLDKKFIKSLQDSIFFKFPKIKLLGTDYYERGLWLEKALYFEKSNKLEKIFVENFGGGNNIKDISFRSPKDYEIVSEGYFK